MARQRLIGLIVLLLAVFSLAERASASGLIKPPNNLGLKAYYSFDDARGTTVTDFSGNGNTAGLFGTTSWRGGKVGQAVQFGVGSSDYAEATTTMSLNASGTVSLWFNTSFVDGNSRCIFCKGDADADLNGIVIAVQSSNGVAWELNSASSQNFANTGAAPTLNRWHHFALTWDGVDIYYYYDGVRTHYNQTLTPITTVYPIVIGSDPVGHDRQFVGMIDEVRVYNRTLSQTEINGLYNNSLGAKINSSQNTFMTDGLVGLWSFDGADMTSSTSTDRSGQGNNGTLTGSSGSQNKPQPKIGVLGQALNFDGTDDYVEVLDPAGGALDFGTATVFTASMWIKATALGTIVSKHDDFVNPGWFLNLTSGGDKLYFRMTSGGAASCKITTATNGPAFSYYRSKWTHVVVTVLRNASCTANDVLFYIDGAQVVGDADTTTANTNLDLNNSTPFRIGNNFESGVPVRHFGGQIDDVRIYNRALSASEVQQLYRAGGSQMNTSVSGISNSLVFWHTFDGPKLNTTTSTDSSAQGRNGTLTNGPIPTLGRIGQGLKMDGSNDRVVISTTVSTLNQAGSYTLAGWARNDDVAGGPGGQDAQAIISSIGNSGNGNSGDFFFGPGADRIVRFANWRANGGGTTGVRVDTGSGGVSISDGVWYHYAATWDGSTSLIYINGVNQPLTTGISTGSGDTLGTYLGTLFTGAANYFWQGAIDDVRVYSRALSAAEILQLYNLGK